MMIMLLCVDNVGSRVPWVSFYDMMVDNSDKSIFNMFNCFLVIQFSDFCAEDGQMDRL